MTDLISRLNEISQLQGRDTIDPTVIQESPTPPPEFQVRPPVDLDAIPDGPEYDDETDSEESSPLIPRVAPPAPTPPVGTYSTPDLMVAGVEGKAFIASYQSREVLLSELESAQVKRVVLKAIARKAKEELDAIERLLPKRKRRKVGVAGAAPAALQGSPSAAPPAKRGPGRPRKVRERLDGTVK